MESRIRQKASACAALAAITASATSPSSIAAASRRSTSRRAGRSVGGRRLDQHVPAMIAGQRARVPGTCSSTSCSESAGTSSNPSTVPVSRFEEAEQVERRCGARNPGPGDGTRGDRRDEPQRRRGDDPERAFGADQQLVEAVAAIVLLERGQAVVDRAVGQHRLDPRDQRAHRAEAQHLRAPGVGRDEAADGAAAARAQRQRKAPADLAARSCRSARITPASATARLASALDRAQRGSSAAATGSSALPSAGGVAPATMPVLPPCGTSGTRCSAASATICRDLVGRRRSEDRVRLAVHTARASRSAMARGPPRSVSTALRAEAALDRGDQLSDRRSRLMAVSYSGGSAGLALSAGAANAAQTGQRELNDVNRIGVCDRAAAAAGGSRLDRRAVRAAADAARARDDHASGRPCGTVSTRWTGARRRPTITVSRRPRAIIRSASSTRCTASCSSG